MLDKFMILLYHAYGTNITKISSNVNTQLAKCDKEAKM